MKPIDFPQLASDFHSASGDMLAAVLDQSVDCIKVIGPGGGVDYMNRNGRCAMEIDDFALIAGKPWWELWPEESRPLVERAIERARKGQPSQFEAFCPTAKGTPRWWGVSVAPVMDAAGDLQALVSVSRDVTAQVKARELREAAAAEMRHRLQNAYTLAGAVVLSSARGDEQREAFAAQILDKLQRLGIAQRVMLDAEGLGSVTLDHLIRKLISPFETENCSFSIDRLPSVALDEDQVRALALTLGELSTNSNKYGAMGFGGSIALRGEERDGRVILHWSERAEQAVQLPSEGGGNGHSLIRRALGAHGGSIDFDWRADGLDVQIVLPISA